MKRDYAPVFINLSNHPSCDWDETQMAAARHYGQVVDLPFPQIEPTATAQQVQQQAEQVAESIINMGETATITVHVMGEMTFVFHVVTMLKQHGVRCVASTTERIAIEEDFTKVSMFSFVQFREY